MGSLDPRTKIMMMACLSAAAMATDNIIFLLGLSIFLPPALWAGGIGFARQKKQLLGMVGLISFLFVIQSVFASVHLAGVMALRLLIILLAALVLLSGKPGDYLLALTRLGMPYEMAYMVLLGFHFFPLLREEAMDVYYSIQLRGTEIKKAPIKGKLAAYKNMAIPILAGALERARDTSIAMEARGFRSQRRRTYLRKIKLKKRDILLLIIIPLVAASFIYFANRDSGSEDMGREAMVSYMGKDAIAISWGDEEKYEGVVQWEGKEIPARRKEVRKGEYYRYWTTVDGLKRGKNYTYAMGDGKTFSLREKVSLPPKDGDFTFLFMGDIQYRNRERDYAAWGGFLAEAYRDTPDAKLLLMGGDMVEKAPDLKDWSAFLSAGQPTFRKIPVMTTPGNHETSILPTTYLDILTLPDKSPIGEEIYSFDLGGIHFVSLNSGLFMKERKTQEGYEEMMGRVDDWIEKDLKSSKAKWTIAFFHHPMYPASPDDPLYEEMRGRWEGLLTKGGVDLVLCGHQHLYMRTKPVNGITHIMCNSGEKPSNYLREGQEIPAYVEKIRGDKPTYLRIRSADDRLIIEAYEKGGKQVDTCEIKKK